MEKLAIYDVGTIPDLSRLARCQTPAKESKVQIAVHPGSGSPSKNWPLERWKQWCQAMCEDSHYHFMIVAGEAGLRGRRNVGQAFARPLSNATHERSFHPWLEPLPAADSLSDMIRDQSPGGRSGSALARALGPYQPGGVATPRQARDGHRIGSGPGGITSRQVSREAHRLMEEDLEFGSSQTPACTSW